MGRADAGSSTIRLLLARFASRDRAVWLARTGACLSAEERERVATFVDPDARTQHAVGRTLLKLVGAQAIGCHPRCVTVAVTDTGKPWLPQLPDLHVNISHCRRTVAVAVTAAGPVGVDIEPPAAIAVDPLRLADRVFSEPEARELREFSGDRLAERFASVWTIKEAVGKALGSGLIPALAQVVVNVESGLELRAVGQGPPAESWTLHLLTAPEGREKIAVAVPVPGLELAPVSLVTLEELPEPGGCHGATACT